MIVATRWMVSTDIEVNQELFRLVGSCARLLTDQTHVVHRVNITGSLNQVLTSLERGRERGREGERERERGRERERERKEEREGEREREREGERERKRGREGEREGGSGGGGASNEAPVQWV